MTKYYVFCLLVITGLFMLPFLPPTPTPVYFYKLQVLYDSLLEDSRISPGARLRRGQPVWVYQLPLTASLDRVPFWAAFDV